MYITFVFVRDLKKIGKYGVCSRRGVDGVVPRRACTRAPLPLALHTTYESIRVSCARAEHPCVGDKRERHRGAANYRYFRFGVCLCAGIFRERSALGLE